jgi:hypothetical protein
LRVEAVPLGADMDTEIDLGLAITEEQRAVNLGLHGSVLGKLGDIPLVVTGRMAAFIQAAPMQAPAWIDIAVARHSLDELARVIEKASCQRWSERWHDWGFGDSDPRKPGAARWRIGLSDMRLRVVDELPTSIAVRVGDHFVPVVPIAEIERDDPWLLRLMTRWRERSESP